MVKITFRHSGLKKSPLRKNMTLRKIFPENFPGTLYSTSTALAYTRPAFPTHKIKRNVKFYREFWGITHPRPRSHRLWSRHITQGYPALGSATTPHPVTLPSLPTSQILSAVGIACAYVDLSVNIHAVVH